MFYYRWHIGDYKTATAHLTNEEDLAYRKLLDYYYETERPIDKPVEWLARRLRIAAADVQSVLSDFFVREGEAWRHLRCDREIAGMEEAIERSRQNGQLGGRPRKPSSNPAGSQQEPSGLPVGTQQEPSSIPVATQQQPTLGTPSPHLPNYPISPSPKVQTPRADALGSFEEGFQRFWEAYGHKLGKHAAQKAWAKIRPTGELLETIVAKARATSDANPSREFYKNPATWLNGRHWDDEVIPTRSGGGAPKRRSINDDICMPGFSNGADSVQEF